MNTFPGSHLSTPCEAHCSLGYSKHNQQGFRAFLDLSLKPHQVPSSNHTHTHTCRPMPTLAHTRTSPHFSLACVLEVPACMMLFNIISTCLISGQYLNGAACEQKRGKPKTENGQFLHVCSLSL